MRIISAPVLEKKKQKSIVGCEEKTEMKVSLMHLVIRNVNVWLDSAVLSSITPALLKAWCLQTHKRVHTSKIFYWCLLPHYFSDSPQGHCSEPGCHSNTQENTGPAKHFTGPSPRNTNCGQALMEGAASQSHSSPSNFTEAQEPGERLLLPTD